MTSQDAKSQEWRWDKCFDIDFSVNDKIQKNIASQKPFYSLSFKYTFENSQDVYFAYSIPYGFSSLLGQLEKFKEELLSDGKA